MGFMQLLEARTPRVSPRCQDPDTAQHAVLAMSLEEDAVTVGVNCHSLVGIVVWPTIPSQKQKAIAWITKCAAARITEYPGAINGKSGLSVAEYYGTEVRNVMEEGRRYLSHVTYLR